MAIKIFDVLSGKKKELKPPDDGTLGMYVCGVTVYGRCHIGHLRCYLSFDAIYRYLIFRGYNVKYVRNFTDVDDKIIKRALEIMEGKNGSWRKNPAYENYDESMWQARLEEDDKIKKATSPGVHMAESVADYFIDTFHNEDFSPFDLLKPASEPRVSKYISEVIKMIKKIIENGFAYNADGDVYFDVSTYHEKSKEYGSLSRRDFNQMMDGARVAPDEKKKTGADFALWKKAKKGEPKWDSPWGPGRPGWHIECSAMSVKELGQPFDIHGGGKDLIFPHHENEIAQAQAANNKTFCKSWIHNGFVTVNNVKMSKSLGNFITIKESLKIALPEVWRLLILSAHYANPIDFGLGAKTGKTGEILRGSIDIACQRLDYFYHTLKRADKLINNTNKNVDRTDDAQTPDSDIIDEFITAMDDDFNTARAIAVIGEKMRYINELCDMNKKSKKAFDGGKANYNKTLALTVKDIRKVLGVLGLCQKPPHEALSELCDYTLKCLNIDKDVVEKLVKERSWARADKDYKRSDEIRLKLSEMKIQVFDTPDGSTWSILR